MTQLSGYGSVSTPPGRPYNHSGPGVGFGFVGWMHLPTTWEGMGGDAREGEVNISG